MHAFSEESPRYNCYNNFSKGDPEKPGGLTLPCNVLDARVDFNFGQHLIMQMHKEMWPAKTMLFLNCFLQ